MLGTVEIIKLACKGKPKVLNHISSLSVFDEVNHNMLIAWDSKYCHSFSLICETENIDKESTRFTGDGYSKSKWVRTESM